MADPNIKKYRIPASDMPAINSIDEGYSVRFRVVSEDRNRTSHWSPIYLIEPQNTLVPGSIRFSSASQIASFTWNAVVVLESPRSVTDINNKTLSSKIVTLTTDSAHYMSVNDWVTVENVDSTFNGTYKISAVTSNTFSYYKDSGNVAPTAVSPKGTYTENSFIKDAAEYDVWIRWDRNDGGDWIYKERIQGSTISFPHAAFYTINGTVQPSAPNKISIEVYLIGQPIERGNGVPLATGTPFLKVYQLLNQTI
jgi:hypothetical protein